MDRGDIIERGIAALLRIARNVVKLRLGATTIVRETSEIAEWLKRKPLYTTQRAS